MSPTTPGRSLLMGMVQPDLSGFRRTTKVRHIAVTKRDSAPAAINTLCSSHLTPHAWMREFWTHEHTTVPVWEPDTERDCETCMLVFAWIRANHPTKLTAQHYAQPFEKTGPRMLQFVGVGRAIRRSVLWAAQYALGVRGNPAEQKPEQEPDP